MWVIEEEPPVTESNVMLPVDTEAILKEPSVLTLRT
jgi:hypothetical protein